LDKSSLYLCLASLSPGVCPDVNGPSIALAVFESKQQRLWRSGSHALAIREKGNALGEYGATS
jgi:hypothetical protein